jgi:hypothetical protein
MLNWIPPVENIKDLPNKAPYATASLCRDDMYVYVFNSKFWENKNTFIYDKSYLLRINRKEKFKNILK